MEASIPQTDRDTVKIIELIAAYDPKAKEEFEAGNMGYKPDIDSLEVVELEMKLEEEFSFTADDADWEEFKVGSDLAAVVALTNKLRNSR